MAAERPPAKDWLWPFRRKRVATAPRRETAAELRFRFASEDRRRDAEEIQRLRVAEAEKDVRIAQLQIQLYDAYAYRERREGLPPGSLTSKVPT